jgi:tetratricopeptide (TPR) repeat protein
VVVLVFIGILAACDRQGPVTTQPSPSTNTLETAEEYLMRGDNFSARKEYDLAIPDYDQAIRLNPKYAEAYNNRGYAYYWNGDAAHAIADYSRAIELRPDYAYAYNNRGAAYMASGHSDQAIDDFDRAIQLQRDFPQAYINRGNAYLRLGRFGLAFADFRRGGADPVKTMGLLCGLPVIAIFLGAVIMKISRRRLLAKSRHTIEKE